MKPKILLQLITLFWLLTGCDRVLIEPLIGRYNIVAWGSPENATIVYSEKEDISFAQRLISATVIEAEWNDRFIKIKQHLQSDLRETLFNQIKTYIVDSLKSQGIAHRREQIADSISNQEFVLQYEHDQFKDYFLKDFKEVTMYYLIDTESGVRKPMVYFDQERLQEKLSELEVKALTNKWEIKSWR